MTADPIIGRSEEQETDAALTAATDAVDAAIRLLKAEIILKAEQNAEQWRTAHDRSDLGG